MTTTMPKEKTEPPKITVPGIADIKMRPAHHIDYDGDDDGFNDVAFPAYSEDQINAVTALYESEIQCLRSELAAAEQRGWEAMREEAAKICKRESLDLSNGVAPCSLADILMRRIRSLPSTPTKPQQKEEAP